MIVVSLPLPPSLNNLFPTVMTDKGPKRVKSGAYRAWLKEAGWLAKAARGRVSGPFVATLVCDRPADKRKHDLDGLAKAPLDLLTSLGLIDDDSLAERVTLEWSSPASAPVKSTTPMVKVTIAPLEAA